MSGWYDGRLGYDIWIDRVYIPRGEVFGGQQVHYLTCNEEIMIKRRNEWINAVLRRDLGGWYLEAEGIKEPRKFEGRRARAKRRSE